jgi:hypothetical protein
MGTDGRVSWVVIGTNGPEEEGSGPQWAAILPEVLKADRDFEEI